MNRTDSLQMSFDFVSKSIANGFYEPEGIYLTAPFEGRRRVVQYWGDRPEYYRRFAFGMKVLLGHDGLDFEMNPNGKIIAADRGIVTTIGNDLERYGHFIRVSHSWGESLYTRFQGFVVDAGQCVERGELLGYFSRREEADLHFHFGMRIAPYVMADGWGGYSNPLPHLPPNAMILDSG